MSDFFSMCALRFQLETIKDRKMNKNELATTLGLSLGTISRYINMGLPYEKVKGKYDFDINEAQDWIDDNIDRRPQNEYRPTLKEIADWGLDFASNLLYYVAKCKHCNNKISQDVKSGKFGNKR